MKRLAVTGLLILVAVAAFLLWQRFHAPVLPLIARTGLDPAIAKSVNEAATDVEESRRSPAAWGRLGMVLKAGGLNVEALECFNQAEKLDPADARWPYLRATLLFPARAAEALAKMRRAAQLSSQEFIQLRLGHMLVEMGEWSDAEEVFRKILSASSGHSGARLGLAQIYQAQGKWKEAVEQVKYSLDDPHTAKAATVLLASAQLRLGQAEAAREFSRRAAALPPDVPWADPFEAEVAKYQAGLRPLIEETQRLLAANRVEEALALSENLLSKYPRAAEGWLYLGRARLMQGDLQAAEKALSRHLQLDPASFDGQIQLGLVFHRQRRLADAAARFQKALASKPDSETAHYFIGVVHLQEGNTNAAVQSFRAALRYQPGYAPAQKSLAEAVGR